jgi:carbon starvation protein CstA
MDRVATLIPVIVGSTVIVSTIVIHGVLLEATLRLLRQERTLGHVGGEFWIDLRIVSMAIMLALVAHLIEIGVWAALFVLLGEFETLGVAFYHSAINYTTLGYGDIVMSPAWKTLGPIEAINGLLMFGVSTAMIFAVIQRMLQIRFPELDA